MENQMDKDKVAWSDYIWHIGNIQLVEAWTFGGLWGDTFSLRRRIMLRLQTVGLQQELKCVFFRCYKTGFLTLKVLVMAVDALRHILTG